MKFVAVSALFSTAAAAIDCTQSACQKQCECALDKCADEVKTCSTHGHGCPEKVLLQCVNDPKNWIERAAQSCITSNCNAVEATAEATAEAGSLAVTWNDCGAKHATVTGLQPTTISTGATETLTGSGTVDEDVTKAQFTATVKAAGATLATCSGDGTADIECKLPLGAGVITVKALTFPIPKGTVNIPVTVKTSSFLPPSLAKVDVHIAATDQNGEDVVCLDVHTTKAMEFISFQLPEAMEMEELDLALNLNMTQADHSACLAAVKRYVPGITLCNDKYSAMADTQAAYDSTHGPHAYLKTKGWTGTCAGLSTGQCECPKWGSEQQANCVAAYQNEGPGGGHYDIMHNSGSKCVACGYSAGTMTHNFCGSDSKLIEEVVV